MSLALLMKVELNKLKKRKDVWLILFMIAIPMLYAIGAYFNASFVEFKSDNKTYGMEFAVNMYQFIYAIFIFFFLTMFCVIKSLGTEIEDHSIILYIPRSKSRTHLYLAKNMSLTLVFTVITIFFYVFSIAMYYIFLVQRSDIAMPHFWEQSETLYLLVNTFAIYLYYIMLIQLAMFLCTILKPMLASITSLLVITLTLYLQQIPKLQMVIPGFYINKFMNSDWFSQGETFKNISIFLILIAGYCLIFNVLGMRKFKRLDL